MESNILFCGESKNRPLRARAKLMLRMGALRATRYIFNFVQCIVTIFLVNA